MINPYQPPRNDSFPLTHVPLPMKPTTQVALIATLIAFGVGYQLVQNLRIASGDLNGGISSKLVKTRGGANRTGNDVENCGSHFLSPWQNE